MFVHGRIFRFSKWSMEFSPNKDSPVVPIWLHMPGLPANFFSEPMIRSIAGSIGPMLQVDQNTSRMIRADAAVVCVQLDVSKKLPDRVWVGVGGGGFWQPIVYPAPPLFCTSCSRLGHSTKNCKQAATEKSDNTTQGAQEDHIQSSATAKPTIWRPNSSPSINARSAKAKVKSTSTGSSANKVLDELSTPPDIDKTGACAPVDKANAAAWRMAPTSTYLMLNMAYKLKHMKNFYRRWNKEIFVNVSLNVQQAEAFFATAQKNLDEDPSQDNHATFRLAKDKLDHGLEFLFILLVLLFPCVVKEDLVGSQGVVFPSVVKEDLGDYTLASGILSCCSGTGRRTPKERSFTLLPAKNFLRTFTPPSISTLQNLSLLDFMASTTVGGYGVAFLTAEQQSRFASVKAKICGNKAVDLANLKKNGMGSLVEALQRLKWTKIATLSEVSYPDLVKAFYVCLKTEEDGTLTSLVKGTQIRISRDHLASLFDVSTSGLSGVHSEDTNIKGLGIIGLEFKLKDGKLDINQLNAFNRLADSDLMYWAIQNQEINTAELIIKRMKFASSQLWDTKRKSRNLKKSGFSLVNGIWSKDGTVEDEAIIGEAQEDQEPSPAAAVASAAAIEEAPTSTASEAAVPAAVPSAAEEEASRRIEDIPPESIEPFGASLEDPPPQRIEGKIQLNIEKEAASQGAYTEDAPVNEGHIEAQIEVEEQMERSSKNKKNTHRRQKKILKKVHLKPILKRLDDQGAVLDSVKSAVSSVIVRQESMSNDISQINNAMKWFNKELSSMKVMVSEFLKAVGPKDPTSQEREPSEPSEDNAGPSGPIGVDLVQPPSGRSVDAQGSGPEKETPNLVEPVAERADQAIAPEPPASSTLPTPAAPSPPSSSTGHIKADVLAPILSECERLSPADWTKLYPLSAQQLGDLNASQASSNQPPLSPGEFLDANSLHLIRDSYLIWVERYKGLEFLFILLVLLFPSVVKEDLVESQGVVFPSVVKEDLVRDPGCCSSLLVKEDQLSWVLIIPMDTNSAGDFWFDVWTGDTPLRTYIPEDIWRDMPDKLCTIQKAFSSLGSTHLQVKFRYCPNHFMTLFLTNNDTNDTWIWCPTSNRKFSTKSVRLLLQTETSQNWAALWSPYIPLKWSILVWRMVQNLIPVDVTVQGKVLGALGTAPLWLSSERYGAVGIGQGFKFSKGDSNLNAIIPKVVIWLTPPQGRLKLNVDGAFNRTTGEARGGGILRDHKGNMSCAFANPYNYLKSSLAAEALAFRDGILMCCNKGIDEVFVETDSLNLMHIVTGQLPRPWDLAFIMQEIVAITMKVKAEITHIPRESNKVADCLAKFAYSCDQFTAWDSWADVPNTVKAPTVLIREGAHL
ncbi:hypothetical protein Taro_022095 [Colocasia esculenta]|uniref:RNase H type-1 domain-containing protein n=1 Tax=Colocasia esculenta TaxID=4460 RepID=A0A843V0K0_COLES|nr:hypothetical protein [Colocasia esculenta]